MIFRQPFKQYFLTLAALCAGLGLGVSLGACTQFSGQRRVVDVLVPVALDQAYSYRVPAELDLAPGRHRVACRLARARPPRWSGRTIRSPIRGSTTGSRTSSGKLELPPLRPELRSFVDWVANYTVSSRGMVLRMCLRMGEHLGAERERVGVRLAGAPPQRMTSARHRVLELLADGMVRGKGEAAREAGVSAGVIDGLIDEGTLRDRRAAAGAGCGKARSRFHAARFRRRRRAPRPRR